MENGDPMYYNFHDIAWCPFDITISDVDRAIMAAEIEGIPEEHWYWCTYRNCWLLLLYGNDTNVNNKREMAWLPYTSECHTLRHIVDDRFDGMFTTKPRIIIIRTEPGRYMPVHIDCTLEECAQFNPKLRVVLKGKLNTLQYLNHDGQEITIPDQFPVYYMAGNAPHSMHNSGDIEKYTLCFGDPWLGDDLENTEFVVTLTRSLIKYESFVIRKSQLGSIDQTPYIKNTSKEEIYGRDEYEHRLSSGGYTGIR